MYMESQYYFSQSLQSIYFCLSLIIKFLSLAIIEEISHIFHRLFNDKNIILGYLMIKHCSENYSSLVFSHYLVDVNNKQEYFSFYVLPGTSNLNAR